MQRFCDWLAQWAGSPRALRATTLACGALIAGWLAYLLHLRIATYHTIPDYGDVFRLIEIFLIPWESAGSLERLALMLEDFNANFHSAILIRLGLLFCAALSPASFNALGIVGLAAYAAMVGWIAVTASRTISDPRQRMLVLAVVAAAYVRPDEIGTIATNLLGFEYIFLFLGLAYLHQATRNALADRESLAVIGLGVAAVLFGDPAGVLAACGAVVLTAICVATKRCRFRLLPWTLLPLLVGAALDVANRSFLANVSKLPPSSFQPDVFGRIGEAIVWLFRGVGMTVVYVQPFTVAEIGMDPEWVVAFYTGIGAILTAAVFAVLWFLFRRATESDALTLALLMYGLLTIAGTFLGRYDSPHEVFMPRYVRHFYCIPVGLLVFALSRARPIFSLQSAGVRTLLALIVCGIVVFRAPSGVRRYGTESEWYRGPTRLLADYSPELTSQELEAYHPMLHQVGRANDESAHRVLAWTLERVIEKEPTEP